MQLTVSAEFLAKLEKAGLLEAFKAEQKKQTLSKKIKSAKFPFVKTFEDYDFAEQPDINKAILLTHDFSTPQNILFFGPVGTGKTHLSVSCGIAALEKKIKVKYFVQPTLLLALKKNFVRTTQIPLVIVDEIGYPPLNEEDAGLFFQFISARHEKLPTICISNKKTKEWVANDIKITMAILDRLFQNSKIFYFEGESKRLENIK